MKRVRDKKVEVPHFILVLQPHTFNTYTKHKMLIFCLGLQTECAEVYCGLYTGGAVRDGPTEDPRPTPRAPVEGSEGPSPLEGGMAGGTGGTEPAALHHQQSDEGPAATMEQQVGREGLGREEEGGGGEGEGKVRRRKYV